MSERNHISLIHQLVTGALVAAVIMLWLANNRLHEKVSDIQSGYGLPIYTLSSSTAVYNLAEYLHPQSPTSEVALLEARLRVNHALKHLSDQGYIVMDSSDLLTLGSKSVFDLNAQTIFLVNEQFNFDEQLN
ncbi:hypothetical protein [uncultured Umboniibacter sp.]|uniref:hypothetical protein n=1 Tax=uncultured Umboniibacter sp. TaxID=1798917 RepID=UPI002623AC55|nr:hypothetical protein [uncultured Umboniibacter sp.]